MCARPFAFAPDDAQAFSIPPLIAVFERQTLLHEFALEALVAQHLTVEGAIDHPAFGVRPYPAMRLAHVNRADAHAQAARLGDIHDVCADLRYQLFLDL